MRWTMRTRMLAVGAVLAGLIGISATSVAAAPRYYDQSAILAFDVDGFRLRMSHADALAVLRERGYDHVERALSTCTFSEAVANELMARARQPLTHCSRMPSVLRATSANGTIELYFGPDSESADGVGIADVKLRFGNVANDKILPMLVGKYGTPTAEGGMMGKVYYWHSGGTPVQQARSPRLLYSVSPKEVYLQGVNWIVPLRDAAIKAAADRTSPPAKPRI